MTIDEIYTRSSVRSYRQDTPVSEEDITAMLRAAMCAPSAGNKQPWAFVVVKERATIDALADVLDYGKFLKKSPLVIVLCGDITKTIPGEGKEFWVQDVSAATENMLLAAHCLGLGAVWLGIYPMSDRTAALAKILGLPENIIPMSVVSAGHPKKDPNIKDKWDETKIHREKW